MARLNLEGYPDGYLLHCGLGISVTMTEAVQKLRWGTYGSFDAPGQLVWKQIVDLSSDHLCNILRTETHIDDVLKQVILYILTKRGV